MDSLQYKIFLLLCYAVFGEWQKAEICSLFATMKLNNSRHLCCKTDVIFILFCIGLSPTFVKQTYKVGMEGSDEQQCLNQRISCKTITYIIENACINNVQLALHIEKTKNLTYVEPCTEAISNSSFDCNVIIFGVNFTQKPQIEFGSKNQIYDLSKQCNIFQMFMNKAKITKDPVICSRDSQANNNRSNKLTFINLMIFSLVLHIHGQLDFSAENVNFIDLQLTVGASSRLPCFFSCNSCSFSISQNRISHSGYQAGQIELANCLCLSVSLTHSSITHISDSFLQVLDAGQQDNYSFSEIHIKNCSTRNNIGFNAFFMVESSCLSNVSTVMQVILENSLFEGNWATMSPMRVYQCDGKRKLLYIGKMLVSNCTFLDNTGEIAGAISLGHVDASMIVTNCKFLESVGKYAGSIYIDGSDSSVQLSVSSSQFVRNSGEKQGSLSIEGHQSSAFISISSSQFYESTGGNEGYAGAVYMFVHQSTILMSVNTCEFNSNSGKRAGSMYLRGNNSSLGISVNNSDFQNNSAKYAGTIYLYGTGLSHDISVSNSRFHNNRGNNRAGSFYFRMRDSSLDVSVSNSDFQNNSAKYAGTIYLYGTGLSHDISVSNSRFHNNRGNYRAGSFYFRMKDSSLDVSVSNSDFHNNTGEDVGSVYLEGSGSSLDIRVSNSEFHKNTGELTGAVFLYGEDCSLDISVNNSEFYKNTGESTGAMFLYGEDCSLDISVSNSEFVRNKGHGPLSAGSMLLDGPDSLLDISLDNSEFNTNTGELAGSVYLYGKGSSLDFCVSNSEFHSNTGEVAGSMYLYGMDSSTDISVSNNEFHNNSAKKAGAIYLYGTGLSHDISVSNSRFHNNTGNIAGSLYLYGEDCSLDISVSNSEFVRNKGHGPLSAGSMFLNWSDSLLNIILRNSEFNKHTGELAGSVYVYGKRSSLDICVSNSEFHSNTGEVAGSINLVGEDSLLDFCVSNSEFHNNSAEKAGAIYVNGELDSSLSISVNNSKFVGNIAHSVWSLSTGSILFMGYDSSQVMSLRSSEFDTNTGEGAGSVAILVYYIKVGSDSTYSLDMSVSGCKFFSNTGGTSGAIRIDGSSRSTASITVTKSSFTNNTGKIGGALGVFGSCSSKVMPTHLQISFSQFLENIATKGGSAMHISVDCIVNETSMIIALNNTDFSHNVVPDGGLSKSGGALYLSSGNPPSITFISIMQCTWLNNTSSTHGGALAFNLYESSEVHIVQSQFISNKATGVISDGGACYFQIAKENLCSKEGQIQIKECIFEHNIAVAGGSVFQTSEQSMATKFGIENSKLFCCTGESADFISVVISSELKNIQFYYVLHKDDLTVAGIFFKAEGPHLFENVFVSCYKMDIILSVNSLSISSEDNALEERIDHNNTVSVFSAYCTKCITKPFPAGNGSLYITQNEVSTRSTHKLFQHHFSLESPCQPCPFGGNCINRGITALPNYWGYQEGIFIFFLSCPPQYCCSGIDVPCEAIDTCAPYRTGQMCGQCEEGFTESLMSTVCIEDKLCDDWWVWPLSFVLAFSYLMWYMYRGKLLNIFPSVIKRCKFHVVKHSSNIDENTSDECSDSAENAFFDILVYFSNIISLLNIQVKFENSDRQAGLLNDIEKYFMKYLDIDVQQILHLELCPFVGINATVKTLARPIFTVFVLLVWCLLFSMTAVLTSVLVCRHLKETHYLANILKQFKFKLLEGFIETCKYSYSGFAGATFILLTCVEIRNKFFWKYDAQIECYSILQKSVILFACLYTVPFVFISPVGGKLLRAGTVRHTEVMFACLCPFPVITYWGIRHLFIKAIYKNAVGSAPEQQTDQRVSESNGTTLISKEAQIFLDTYQGAYKDKYCFWESVIEIRKLIFCSFYLIQNNMFRLVFCTIFSVMCLVHHNAIQPYGHINSNRVETLSLSLLCVACVTNGIKSVFSQLGLIVELNTPTEQLLIFLNRIDKMFVFFLLSYMLILGLCDIVQKRWQKKLK